MTIFWDVTPWSVCTDVSEENRASIIRWIYSAARVIEAEVSSETFACQSYITFPKTFIFPVRETEMLV